MVHWLFILGRGWLLSNNFVNRVKTVFVKFCHSTQCITDAWILALLWKLPQIHSCSANNANLDKFNFDMFYQTYCCTAIHGRIWMKNIPNERIIIMPSCTEISFISFVDFESNPGFPFFILHYSCTYSITSEKIYYDYVFSLAIYILHISNIHNT